MIKLTLKQLTDAMQSGAISRLVTDRDLSMKAKYRLKDIWKQALGYFEQYEESRIELCKEHGYLENGNYEFESDDKKAEFNAAVIDLKSVEVTLTGNVFTFADLTKKIGAADTLSAEDLFLLEWLIVDEIEEAAKEETAAAANA